MVETWTIGNYDITKNDRCYVRSMYRTHKDGYSAGWNNSDETWRKTINVTSPRGKNVLSESKYFHLTWPLSSISQLPPWNILSRCLLLLLSWFSFFEVFFFSLSLLLSFKHLVLIFFLHYVIHKWFISCLPKTLIIHTDNLKCVLSGQIFVLSPKPVCPTAYCSPPPDCLTSTSTQMSRVKFMLIFIDLFIF